MPVPRQLVRRSLQARGREGRRLCRRHRRRPRGPCVGPSGSRAARRRSQGSSGWEAPSTRVGRSVRRAPAPTTPSDEDIDFNHEAELLELGSLPALHGRAWRRCRAARRQLQPRRRYQQAATAAFTPTAWTSSSSGHPTSATDAFASYARNSKGGKAIYRAPIRTGPQGSLCTAHVFQQVPGQNRIFMGWYSQGTQVIDFTENADGTLDFKEAGYYVPASANQWTSHVFKVVNNQNGSFTYYGAATDFSLGRRGPQHDRHLQGHAAGAARAARPTRRHRRGLRTAQLPGPPCTDRQPQHRPSEAPPDPRPAPLAAPARSVRAHPQAARAPLLRQGPQPQGSRRRGVRPQAQGARGDVQRDAGHKRKKIGAGSSRKALRRKFGNRLRKIGPGLRIVRGSRKARNRVVFKITKTRVRYVALTDRKLANEAEDAARLSAACQAALGGSKVADVRGPGGRAGRRLAGRRTHERWR